MIQQSKSKKLILPMVIASTLTIIQAVFWRLGFSFLNANLPSFRNSTFMILRLVTELGPDILIICLGYYFASRSPKNRMPDVVKIWSYLLFVGLLGTVILSFMNSTFSLSAFYNVLFPVTRNSYSILTGVLIAVIGSQYIDAFLQHFSSKQFVFLLFVVMLIPTLFDQDVFMTNGGFSLYLGIFLFVIGFAVRRYQNKNKLPLRKFGLLFVLISSIRIILNYLMPRISFAIRGDISTATRFSGSQSMLTIVSSFLAFVILLQLGTQIKSNQYYQFDYLYIVAILAFYSNSYLYSGVITFGNRIFGTSVIQKLITTSLTVIGIPIILYFINRLLFKIKLVKKYLAMLNRELISFSIFDFANWLMIKLKNFYNSGQHKVYIWMIAAFYFLSAFSLLIMNHSWTIEPNVDRSYNIFIYTLFVRHALVDFNVLIIASIFSILWMLTSRFWVSFLTTSAFVVVWGVAGRIKMSIRDEPILPSDMSVVSSIHELFGMVSPAIVISIVVALVLILVLIIFLEIRSPLPWVKMKTRTILGLCGIIFLSSSMFLNHSGSIPRVIANGIGNNPIFYNQGVGAQINGPLQQFLNNIDISIMNKPAGYSKASMQKLAKKYQNIATEINQDRQATLDKQTIIFNLSESFSDPSRVPNLSINKDPMPYIHRLEKDYTSGYMMSSGYGGGTANMEYMSLTGFTVSNFAPTLSVPYTQLVTTLDQAPSIVSDYKLSAAIHPYVGTFYSRIPVYGKFGFDRFYHLGSKYPITHQSKIDNSPYLSDTTAYKNTLDLLKSTNNSQFINLITMQNHYPYNKNFYNQNLYKVSGSAVNTADAVKSAEDFAMGVHYTDDAVKSFIEQIDKIKKPITLVFYGDHLPGIYSGDSMLKYGLELHQTDYFIYSNRYSKAHGVKLSNTSFVGPNDFIALAAKQTDSKVSAFYALLTQVQSDLPTMSISSYPQSSAKTTTTNQFVDQKGKVITLNQLSKKQQQLYRDYLLVQYDLNAGQQYLLNENFTTLPD